MDSKNFVYSDLVREKSAEQTLSDLEHIVHKIGISRVSNITYLDHFFGLFFTNCIRPNSKNLSVSQGKGFSLELSKISAIMESIEGYHIERVPPYVFTASFEDKQFQNMINPNQFCLNAHATKLDKIQFKWRNATELFTGAEVFIPSSLTQINNCLPNFDYLYFNVSSNGLAAGNSKNEALFHSLCEIIERDSLAKWQRSENKKKYSIKSNSVDDFNSFFIEKLSQKKITVRIWEITSNLGIPAYHVAIADNNSIRGLNIFTGTGAHLSHSTALFRALSEAIQGRLSYISGSRDDILEGYYTKMRQKDTKFMSGSSHSNAKNYEYTPYVLGTVSESLNKILNILKDNNYSQIYVVDHTQPEINIPVIQVFIPDMQVNTSRM